MSILRTGKGMSDRLGFIENRMTSTPYQSTDCKTAFKILQPPSSHIIFTIHMNGAIIMCLRIMLQKTFIN